MTDKQTGNPRKLSRRSLLCGGAVLSTSLALPFWSYAVSVFNKLSARAKPTRWNVPKHLLVRHFDSADIFITMKVTGCRYDEARDTLVAFVVVEHKVVPFIQLRLDTARFEQHDGSNRIDEG
ncbi:MAG: hypothetical protein KAJ19_20665 [Gammaproteobacteria bacterium]|nr:hypothetical protein [Gammaproteobacteria bacterium]